MPSLNPDGVALRRAGNANGVDVNRNFPAKNWKAVKNRTTFNGTAPSTEPESRAIQQAINSLNPEWIISIHSIARGKHCNNYDGPAEVVATCTVSPVQYLRHQMTRITVG